jgi:hypothetical protein
MIDIPEQRQDLGELLELSVAVVRFHPEPVGYFSGHHRIRAGISRREELKMFPEQMLRGIFFGDQPPRD